jgi:hypothetical protein
MHSAIASSHVWIQKTDFAIENPQPLPAARLLAFFLLPLAVIALCVATGAALRRFTPGLYGLLTGGRGMGV